jgi:hypothetical protein
MLKFFVSFLLALTTLCKVLDLHECLTLEYDIMNPKDPVGQAIVKFKLILHDGPTGWASIGFRREPDKYPWPMANADYIVCYDNEEEGLGCFDGYMFNVNETGADESEWNDFIPRPLPDSHPAVGGTDDVVFLKNESFKKKVGDHVRTEWVFVRKANTGDSLDWDLAGKNHARAIWAFHEDRPIWEKDPKNWTFYNVGAYHDSNFGHFFFFLEKQSWEL